MWFPIYFTIAFVVFFFQWKKRSPLMFKQIGKYEPWISSMEFWKIALITLFFPIALPLKLLWKALEKITKL